MNKIFSAFNCKIEGFFLAKKGLKLGFLGPQNWFVSIVELVDISPKVFIIVVVGKPISLALSKTD
ncbi:hypothetical protein EFL91_03110 [Fructilactobacillus fructivorans]|nr:hypothetical protein [Fructilactobacillus fructivorans]